MSKKKKIVERAKRGEVEGGRVIGMRGDGVLDQER